MTKRKKKAKKFVLKVGSRFENVDEILEIDSISEFYYFTVTSKVGLPIFHGVLNFGTLISVLLDDNFKQIK